MTVAAFNAGKAPGRLPEPEEVFLAWLLVQPANGDLAAAADLEIGRLAAYRGVNDGPARLGAIFREFRAMLAPRAGLAH